MCTWYTLDTGHRSRTVRNSDPGPGLPAACTLPAPRSPASQGSTTVMVRLGFLLLCVATIARGLEIEAEDGQREKLEKVLEDTIANIELDGDNVDFPAWSSSESSPSEDIPNNDNTVPIFEKEVNEVLEEGVDWLEDDMKITDFIQKYLAHQFNKPVNHHNRWNFWKDFVLPHATGITQQNSVWKNNLGGLHSHLHSEALKVRNQWQWSNHQPQNNWWKRLIPSADSLQQMVDRSSVASPDTADSMITIYHKMTVDNNTREGEVQVPYDKVMPFMRTVWNSLPSDSHMALGLGAFLPLLGLMMPVMVFSFFVLPIIVLVMVTVFGLMSGILVLMPLLLTGLLGQGALPVDRILEELFLEDWTGPWTGMDFLDEDLEKLREKYDKLDVTEDVSTQTVPNTDTEDEEIENETIPRYLGF